jgi:hypothetical protein
MTAMIRRFAGLALGAAFGAAFGLALAAGAAAQDGNAPAGTALPPAAGTETDCTKVTVDYADEPTHTREERIAAMDRALYRSLSKFDACQTAATTGGAAPANGAAGGGGSDGATGGGGVSTAASDISGTEAAPTPNPAGRANPELARTTPAGADADGKWTRPPEPAPDPTPDAAANGKVPEDIPPGDNDSVLEAQIRQAAINETDPEVRARLWDEYRRYKGISTAR